MVKEGGQPNGQSSIGLERLLEKIYQERGFDFREYKEGTLTRRLGRRLWARGVKEYDDYARILDQDPGEYEMLFDDLTINVTSFFRDDFVFRTLEEVVLPKLIEKNTNNHKTLQIWSAACATGEEPYSLAILLLEMLGEKIDSWKVNIIATDIDAKALSRAKEGVFASKQVEDIQPALLKD
ncbi:hypothetical protein KJ693_09375 [bacterium]|nr:hypothetical protein [bacterium]MBU1615504.1 hypothetical protein [bacterium]